jgi:peptidoglycan/xylan/chitin deacetylase (PgdA/CDA1 family)
MKRSKIGLLNAVGAASLARMMQRQRVVVLAYHGVLAGDGGDDYLDHNFVSADDFESQLRHLVRHYRPTTLRELVSTYRDGRTPPPGSVAVTFDDGFANNYSVAYPILRRYSVPFTVFVTTGLIDNAPGAMLWTERAKRAMYLHEGDGIRIELGGKDLVLNLRTLAARVDACKTVLSKLKRLEPAARDRALDDLETACGSQPVREHERERYDFLTWAQASEMASAGVEIGSHTVRHPILTTLDAESLRQELSESKRRIEAMLGRGCEAFAYPNGAPGDFGPREKDTLRDCGYTCALSLKGTLNNRPDPYEIDRVNIGRHLDMDGFCVAATGLLAVARRTRDRIVGATMTSAASQRGQG